MKALRIVNSDKNKPSFYAALKEERDAWVMFLKELNSGHKYSITLREKNMVNVAVNNVMVVQVFSFLLLFVSLNSIYLQQNI